MSWASSEVSATEPLNLDAIWGYILRKRVHDCQHVFRSIANYVFPISCLHPTLHLKPAVKCQRPSRGRSVSATCLRLGVDPVLLQLLLQWWKELREARHGNVPRPDLVSRFSSALLVAVCEGLNTAAQSDKLALSKSQHELTQVLRVCPYMFLSFAFCLYIYVYVYIYI